MTHAPEIAPRPQRLAALAGLLALWAALALPAAAQTAERTAPDPGPNGFEMRCHFATACSEAAPCEATDVTAALSGRIGGLGAGLQLARADLSLAGRRVEAIGTLSGPGTGGTLFLQGGAGTERHYLAIARSAARYTVHAAEGPVSTTYIGTCE
ncbi:hypothetical protein [Rhodovulum visakhapatnamense]|uniref:Uncharacterized protein n=1 Tax=Rhodovulum visakhapatnamense TaxID=364297 RepID=A0A4R8G239_9RHOB|nr:hypothetical protein [Rhodovulum visakhapatnamense]TDX33861.1 hypothetical protein EV657_101290 [Rhodovulum visakhapatnamense]